MSWRPWSVRHHGHPQGVEGDPAAAGQRRRVRLAAAVSEPAGRLGAGGGGRPAVVDIAGAGQAAELSRGPGDVHPRRRVPGRELVFA